MLKIDPQKKIRVLVRVKCKLCYFLSYKVMDKKINDYIIGKMLVSLTRFAIWNLKQGVC